MKIELGWGSMGDVISYLEEKEKELVFVDTWMETRTIG